MNISFQTENIDRFKKEFLIAWFFANALGLVLGWVLGEWLGLKVAGFLGWVYGQVVAIVIFEGSVWIYRYAVLFRVRAYDVLKPIDTVLWLTNELLILVGLEFSNRSASYREDSIFGIISAPILAYFLGVTGWLILWLIRIQAQKIPPSATGKKVDNIRFLRVGKSLLIYVFYILIVFLSIHYGKVTAELFGVLPGRIVSGSLMGGGLSLITGSALLRLFISPIWDEST